jgi:hypothetical protein
VLGAPSRVASDLLMGVCRSSEGITVVVVSRYNWPGSLRTLVHTASKSCGACRNLEVVLCGSMEIIKWRENKGAFTSHFPRTFWPEF